MENEKLRILKMLENKQISATEAAELLKAVSGGGGGAAPPTQQSGQSFTSHRTDSSHSPSRASHDAKYSDYTPNTGKPESSSSFGMEDLGRKFENFAKDMAPRVQKFTEVVADKIAGAADKVSDVFSVDPEDTVPTSPSQTRAPRPSTPSGKPSSGGVQQLSTELLVEKGGMNELDLSCLAGEIRIKGYNGDKITARISYKTSKHGSPIELVRLGGKYFLKYEADDFSSVSIDAYVPEKAFNVVKIDGINCEVDVSSLSSNQVRISNMNGSMNLKGITASNIFAESSGGRFNVANIICDNAKFENLNGSLDASELDIAELKLSNYNAALSLMVSKFECYSSYLWGIDTGNAKLSINLPTLHDTGYHIKAHAAMSEIKLGLTGLQFLVNEPSLVEARSINFDRSAKKVKMAVETSNAPLVIN